MTVDARSCNISHAVAASRDNMFLTFIKNISLAQIDFLEIDPLDFFFFFLIFLNFFLNFL